MFKQLTISIVILLLNLSASAKQACIAVQEPTAYDYIGVYIIHCGDGEPIFVPGEGQVNSSINRFSTLIKIKALMEGKGYKEAGSYFNFSIGVFEKGIPYTLFPKDRLCLISSHNRTGLVALMTKSSTDYVLDCQENNLMSVYNPSKKDLLNFKSNLKLSPLYDFGKVNWIGNRFSGGTNEVQLYMKHGY